MGCTPSKEGIKSSDANDDIMEGHILRDSPQPRSIQHAKDMEVQLSKTKEQRLWEMDVFVLDNSLRETAVAAIKGQVSSDKDKILESLSGTGLTDIIVASFGQLRRPEDVWLENKSRNNQIDNDWWAFSEMADTPKDSDIFGVPVSTGLLRCKQYGIKNIILEIDVVCGMYDGYTIDNFKELFQNRVDFIRIFSPEAKILFNIRDAPSAYFHDPCEVDYPERMTTMVKAASMLEPKIFGLAFEDPIAELLPWHIGILSAHMKQTMDENNWEDGHLLIHVHKRFALSDAAVLEGLAMGCTGIWCAVCEEGGGMGHPCSLTTLVNLARLGNENVSKRYSLRALYDAAIEITKVTTGALPHSRTEVYGAQAMDVVFAEGGMGAGSKIELAELVNHKSLRNIRVSPFTDEEMMRDKLSQTFGDHLDWEDYVLKSMIILIHIDLEHGQSLQYNGPAGLLDLYISAGGSKNTDYMQGELFKIQRATQKTDPLIKDLRRKFDACRSSTDTEKTESALQNWARRRSVIAKKENEIEAEDAGDNGMSKASLTVIMAASKLRRIAKVARVQDSITYDEFYEGFLTPYHVHSPSVDPMKVKVVKDALMFLDSDGSGQIEWGELLSRAYWVLENTPADERRSWNLKDLLNALFRNARMKDTSRTLFIRKQAKMVDSIVKSISKDRRLQNILKSQDEHVMTAFLTNLLMAGSGEHSDQKFDAEKIDSKSLDMLNNMVHIIFDTHNGEDALDIIIEHIESQNVSMCAKNMRTIRSSLTSSLASCDLDELEELRRSWLASSDNDWPKDEIVDIKDTGHTKAASQSSDSESLSSDNVKEKKNAIKWVDISQKNLLDSQQGKESEEAPNTQTQRNVPLLQKMTVATDDSSTSTPEDELKRLSNECLSLSQRLKELPKFTPEWTLVKIEMKYISEELEYTHKRYTTEKKSEAFADGGEEKSIG